MNQKTSMNMDRYEKIWIGLSIALILTLFVAVSIAGFSMGIQVPAPFERVDPNTVAQEGPFADPGLREVSPGNYEAYILSQTWQFTPRELTVPAGSTITFYITSKDVQHGFKLQDTNLNVQIVPGQVSKMTITMDKPGVYNYICTEYCGGAHAAMFGKLTVTP